MGPGLGAVLARASPDEGGEVDEGDRRGTALGGIKVESKLIWVR